MISMTKSRFDHKMPHSPAPEDAIRAQALEEAACVAEQGLGGYLCPYGRDKPGDPTWNHTDADICPVCHENSDGSLLKCHDQIPARIAARIRALITDPAAIAAWNRRAGGEREQQLEAALKEAQATIEGYQIAIADITAPQWNEIETAPKDGTTIWAVLRHDLYPGMGRKDLERWNGLQVPLRHPGIYESDGRTWDHGWNIAAPVGHGGFPDEWIAGWRPLPAPPRAALAGQTEGSE